MGFIIKSVKLTFPKVAVTMFTALLYKYTKKIKIKKGWIKKMEVIPSLPSEIFRMPRPE